MGRGGSTNLMGFKAVLFRCRPPFKANASDIADGRIPRNLNIYGLKSCQIHVIYYI